MMLSLRHRPISETSGLIVPFLALYFRPPFTLRVLLRIQASTIFVIRCNSPTSSFAINDLPCLVASHQDVDRTAKQIPRKQTWRHQCLLCVSRKKGEGIVDKMLLLGCGDSKACLSPVRWAASNLPVLSRAWSCLLVRHKSK